MSGLLNMRPPVISGGSAFAPEGFPGLALNLDFSDNARLTKVGSKFSLIQGEAPGVGDYIQADDDARPVVSTLGSKLRQAALFSGAQFMDGVPGSAIVTQGPFVASMAIELLAHPANQSVWCAGDDSNRVDLLFGAGEPKAFPQNGSGLVVPVGTPTIITIAWSDVSNTIYYFHGQTLMATRSVAAGVAISGTQRRLGAFGGGLTNFLNGKLGQLVIWNGMLEANQITAGIDWMEGRWL